MYEKFFSLQRMPFSMVPDPDCVHVTGQHADVISGAVFGILERRGILVLTAEAGLGKTTAIRAVMSLLSESNVYSSLISHPTLDAENFLELAMMNFGIVPVPGSKAQRLKALEAFLQAADAAGRVCVLIVDEAHQLPPDALEEVRLLGNIETDKRKLLQILLAGQEELNRRLDLPGLWQLKQRVAFRLTLNRLNRDGVEDYLTLRWTNAGGRALPFTSDALDAIAHWSHGIPRVINAICDNALMLALSDASRSVGIESIEEVCKDLHLATPGFARQHREIDEHSPLQQGEPAAREVPALVQRAAAGASAQRSVPLSVALAEPGDPIPAAGEKWSRDRPSLLKRWMGFLDGHAHADRGEPAPRAGIHPLSLKQRP